MLNARLEAFMRFKTTLIGHVYNHVASAMPTCYIPVFEVEPKARPLLLGVQTSKGKRGEISFSGSERFMAMESDMLNTEHQKVGLAISKLSGRQRMGTHVRCICRRVVSYMESA